MRLLLLVRRVDFVPVRAVVDVDPPAIPNVLVAVVTGTDGIGLGVVEATRASIPQTEQKPPSMVPVHPGSEHFID